MIIELISFGFKYNSQPSVNYLIDVRFLNNPYYVDKLKPLTGLDNDVIEYFNNDADTKNFVEKLIIWTEYIIDRNVKSNKDKIIIAIGCTGGQHRSPYITEQLAKCLRNNPLISKLTIYHTQLSKYNVSQTKE